MTQKSIFAFKEFLLDYGLIGFFQSTFEAHGLVRKEFEDYLRWVHPLFAIRFAFQWDLDTTKKPSFWSQKDNSWIAYICNRKLSEDFNSFSTSTVQKAISKFFGNNKQFGSFHTTDPNEIAGIIIEECNSIEFGTTSIVEKPKPIETKTHFLCENEEDEEEEELVFNMKMSKMQLSDKSARLTNTDHTRKLSFNTSFSTKLKKNKFLYYSVTKTKSNCVYIYFKKEGLYQMATHGSGTFSFSINNKILIEFILDYFSQSDFESGVVNFSDNLSMNPEEYKIQLLSIKKER